MRHRLTVLWGVVILVSCTRTVVVLDERIMGTWVMDKVYEYNNDVTSEHNPNNDRWIEFKADGTFVSDGTPFGRNTGRWTADNEKSILYIDSDVDDDDSEWYVTFTDDETTWKGIGHPRKENTRLVHKRKVE